MTLARPTALIADDEPLLRSSLTRMLVQAWPELEIVAQARNGREAVEQYQELKPTVCFLDVHMPGMTGVEAARQIARDLYQGMRNDHDWGQRFGPEPGDDVLNQLCMLAPRDLRRALMTGFGNARLDGREDISVADLPRQSGKKGSMGFVQ